MREEYLFQRWDTQVYSIGDNREDAYANLSPVYQAELRVGDGRKVRNLEGPLEIGIKKHQEQVDDN